jgi:Tol biopolymer transport system component
VIGSVSLPRGVVPEPILETPGPVAVSPDNRALAFCARSGEGRTILWVRDLDEAAARPLAGTEGARRPFWSPDGRSIGFFTGAAMKRIPASGGSTTTLAAVADARGGTWSRDGTILFAGDYTGGLSRIPEAGGEPRPATTLDTASGEVTHRYPTFLPDGRHFLFLARKAGAGAGEAPAVMVAALDDPVHRPVLQTASNVAFSAGHLLFARERALMAVPFDLDRLETSGDARPIVEDLLVDERFSLAVFSASERGLLAYQGGRASYLTQWVWVDRAGRRLGVLDEPGLHYGAGGIAIAPDGRSCALARLDATTGNAAVWVVDLATGTRRQLESSGEDQSTPVWSTDGKYIAWASSGSSAGIWVRATSGGGSSRRVYANTGDKSAPMSFTPDGRRLVIIDATLPTDADLLEIPVDGGESRRIAAHSGRDEWAALSPDGRWLATQSQESGQPEIYVQPYPGPGGRRQVSREGGSDPRWRGDGRELYFFDARNFLVATTIVADAEGLSIAGTEELFQVRESWSNRYAAARDGQRFLVRMPVETADPSPITFVTDWPAILAAR